MRQMEHMFSGGGKNKTPRNCTEKSNIKIRLKDKAKIIVVCIAFSIIWNIAWNTIPVTAEVTDNVSSSLRGLLGAKNDQVSSSYEKSSTNAKINYLEQEIEQLESEIQMLQTVMDSMK